MLYLQASHTNSLGWVQETKVLSTFVTWTVNWGDDNMSSRTHLLIAYKQFSKKPQPIHFLLILGSWREFGNYIIHTSCSRNRHHFHHHTNIHTLEISQLDLRNLVTPCSLHLEQERLAKKIYALVLHVLGKHGSRNEKARSFNTVITYFHSGSQVINTEVMNLHYALFYLSSSPLDF